MKYRIAMPMRDDMNDRRLDIIDPVWSRENRTIADHGLADVEAATNAVLLALCDGFQRRLTFLDIGAGIGISSMLCAGLHDPVQVIAVESRARSAAMLERIAAVNGLSVNLVDDVTTALRREHRDGRGSSGSGPPSRSRTSSRQSTPGRNTSLPRWSWWATVIGACLGNGPPIVDTGSTR